MRRGVIELILLVVLGAGVGLAYNALSPRTLTVAPKQDRSYTGFRMVATDEVKLYMKEKPGTLLIDARDPEIYKLGHIPGALNLPDDQFNSFYPKMKTTLEKAKLIIVYCDGGSCGTSEALARKLVAKGFPMGEIAIYGDGFPGWLKGKNPIVRDLGGSN